MSRVCDRCGGGGIAAIYVEKIEGKEIDLCKTCEEGYKTWLEGSWSMKHRADCPGGDCPGCINDKTRGRHKRTA